jgi:hypothetical protein
LRLAIRIALSRSSHPHFAIHFAFRESADIARQKLTKRFR